MVWRLISNVWFSVLINGVPYDFFKSSKWLRQGGPLSPALFIIGSEVLSQGLNSLATQSSFVGFKVPRLCPTITHLAFANDVIIFANGDMASLKKVMRILEWYQNDSSQLVNVQKSGYLVHPQMTVARQGVLSKLLNFKRKNSQFGIWELRCLLAELKRFITQICARRLWIRCGLSLWARFLRTKYCKKLHPCQISMSPLNSATWRRILKIRGFAELFIGWRLQDGRYNFWYDNGIGSGAFYLRVKVQEGLSFQDIMENETWVTWWLAEVLPVDIIQHVLAVVGPDGDSPDRMIWTASSSGQFSLSSAYRELHKVKPSSFLLKQVWHASVPLKVSFFMLWLLYSRLALDDVLATYRFHLPSKCSCYSIPQSESILYLFMEGVIVTDVWRFFGSLCEMVFTRGHFQARNKVVFHGTVQNSAVVCQAIFWDLRDAYGLKFAELQ
nr:uncharacterized protein LOC113705856 [Coffea arabica]